MTPSTQTLRLLQISFLPGVGTGAMRKLSAEAARAGFEILMDDDEILKMSSRSANSTKQNQSGWKEVIDRCLENDIRILSPFDKEYPAPLTHISDYPPLLYVKGNIEVFDRISVAVVGTREASRLGLSWARQIAELLTERGYAVTSGLALGIDAAAHEGALRGHGDTTAVLAHGLDKITPVTNRELALSMLASGGALVSEHAPGVPPRPAEFVRRNRIQSGMSVASIIVESGSEGGAIHQGGFTARQGRALFCVSPDDKTVGADEFKYGGAQRLRRELGAELISSRADLVRIVEGGFDNRYVRLSQNAVLSGTMI